MKKLFIALFLALLGGTTMFSQTGVVEGIVLNEQHIPVPDALVSIIGGSSTKTGPYGAYRLRIEGNQPMLIRITHPQYKLFQFRVRLEMGETLELNPVLKSGAEQISEVTILGERMQDFRGITVLSPETIRQIAGANAGVENLLKTLPGVSSNNELSTQYNVRGGNFDENLVYINGIEIYRPFLVRSGQQEGLSFVNPGLVRSVHFSSGGFPAQYGDKLSSVLDITYRRPVDFTASLDASLMGASLTAEGVSNDGRFTALAGARYRDNSLLVEAKQTQTNFRPLFADVQTSLIYQFSDRLEMNFLGALSINDYRYIPLTRQTNFGTLQDPKALVIYYNGQERDQYRTWFGGLKTSYVFSKSYTGQFILSAYHTSEEEYFDILARYRLGTVSIVAGEEFGEVEFTEGIGSQLSHARNKLDALIVNAQHKGEFKLDNHQLDYGIRYAHEAIRDRLREYEVIDSAGFSIRPPLPDFENNQPYQPYEAPITPFSSVRADNETAIDRLQAYLQWSHRSSLGSHETWYNVGIRGHYWSLVKTSSPASEMVFSPRIQLALKPDWKKDMIFRLSGGLYFQPPLYREFRGPTGSVYPSVQSQKALHLVLGQEYGFRMFSRPFTLHTELFYKNLQHVNPYTLQNVRIRYAAHNNAEAYAYGLDLRLSGAFVPGTESWFSLGYLKTEENIRERGFIPRPTDQRLKLGILFQDYVPKFPNLKMYLNLVYQTGLPGGTPAYADPYRYQSRLPDYRRADLGLSYVLKREGGKNRWSHLNVFQEIAVGLELYNMFDTKNSITNTFVRDVYSKVHYAVPDYLSPRVLNLRLHLEL